MHRIQLFHNGEHPGTALYANARQALDTLNMEDVPVERVDVGGTMQKTSLPALAIDGRIVVAGVEPQPHELQLLFADFMEQGDQTEREDAPCCYGECSETCDETDCPGGCGGSGPCHTGGMAGKIAAFLLLLVILFAAVKALS